MCAQPMLLPSSTAATMTMMVAIEIPSADVREQHVLRSMDDSMGLAEVVAM
jgi:hypothetical protein